MRTIRAAGALPVFVAYNIPHRDCGGYSGGGAPDAAAYRDWINQLAAGLAGSPAVVLLELDSLTTITCLSSTDQQERYQLLQEAVTTLTNRPGVSVYLDAGHARWVPTEVMAARLRAAGIDRARGFALNVSGFQWLSDEVADGDALAVRLGGKHFVVDTSRNGQGPASGSVAWCNPVGRALGAAPTAATGDVYADAFLWVKHPGLSDGTCGRGDPPAGQWWTAYAVGLAQRSR